MRLIDADKLIDYFKRLSEECYETENRSNGMLYEVLCGKVAEQPTVYDVDKVVAELEKLKNDRDCQTYCYEFFKKKCENYDKAIDIVKRGGV